MRQYIPYIIILLTGIIIGSMLTCSGQPTSNSTKTVIKTHTDTVTNYITKEVKIPVNVKEIVYKDPKTVYLKDTIEIEKAKEEYSYTYTGVVYDDESDITSDVKIEGWGGLSDISWKHRIPQRTITNNTETTTTETILKTPNALYLSGEYLIQDQFNKSSLRAHIDWNIRGRVIIGGSIGVDRNDKIIPGIKVGLKL